MVGHDKKIRDANNVVLADVRKKPCSVCRNPAPSDASHIRSRGAGGPDQKFNVVPHCRRHHNEWHQIGAKFFFTRYPHFWIQLEEAGWYFDLQGKLTHPQLEAGAMK